MNMLQTVLCCFARDYGKTRRPGTSLSKARPTGAALFSILLLCAYLAGCGGSSGGSDTPADSTYSIGGNTTGLSGTVVLQNNGGDNLTVSADGNFAFDTELSDGDAYAVTVLTQPTGQTCTVSSGAGTVSGADVTDVAVACTDIPYTIGGTVSGLAGTVVLQNNAGDDLSVSADGSFTFDTSLTHGDAYAVTVLTHPGGQVCTVSNGSGTVNAANVANVSVTCVTPIVPYTIGGAVSGLTGTVVLRNNGGDSLTVSANGSFTFGTALADGNTYAVTVQTQPTGQTCTVSNGSGTVNAANVTNVAVTCANLYSVGGTISGLTGTVVLQNNGGNNLSVSADGGFAFSTKLSSGSAYAVTVLTQPTGQTCTVSSGSGTISGANVTGVSVTCTDTPYSVGGAVSGLTGTVVLQNNAGDNLSVSADGGFTFVTTLANNAAYTVTVSTQPVGQTCVVSNGSGTVNAANVTNVAVTCSDIPYTIGGTVTGLTGTVVLQNNAGDDLSVSANGNFSFTTTLTNGAAYAVTVLTQPSGQTCTVSSGSGTVSTADVTGVTVTCASLYSVGGTVTGLTGTVVLQNNAGDDLTVLADGGFTFATTLVDSATYAVTVLTQPAGQICTVSSGSGTISGANVTGVTVTCAAAYTIGGTVTGLTGTVVLQNNAGDDLSVSADGGFTFATGLVNSATYAVTVLTQPSGQVCTVSSGSGTVSAANVSNVAVTCATAYDIGGTVTGLTGTVVLQNNAGDDLSVSADGSFTFATSVLSGGAYAVTVLTQPVGQTCTVSSGSGTVSGADVTNVAVDCASVLTLGVALNPDRVRPGEGLTASIRLGNTDAAAVDNVKLRATVPATGVNATANSGYVSGSATCSGNCDPGEFITWNIGSLGGGESTVVSVPLVVTAGTADGTVITLPVEVLVDGVQVLSTSASVTVGTANALSLALDGDQDMVAPDDTLTYTLTYANRDTAASVTGMALSLPLPEGVTFVSASGGGTLVGDTVEWSLSDLPAGQAGLQQAVVTVDGSLLDGTILRVDAAQLTGTNNVSSAAELARATAATRIKAAPALGLAIEMSPDPVQAQLNKTITTILTVTNRSGTDLSGTVLQARIPTDRVNTSTPGNGGTCLASSCNKRKLVTWSIGTLAAGAGTTVTLQLPVINGSTIGTLVPLDSVVTADDVSPAAASHTVVIDNNPLLLTLAEDHDPVAPGGTLTYTLSYQNLTGGSITGTVLSLPLPPGVNFVSASNSGALIDGVVQWSLGTLTSDSQTVTVTVDNGLPPDAGTLLVVNAAQLSGTSATTGTELARATAVTRVVGP